MNAKRFLQLSVSLLLLLAITCPTFVKAQSPQVLYVKPAGLTSGSCESWANACELQYALNGAFESQEIWMAGGVYRPTTDPVDTTASFTLKNGVDLFGGFAGTETAREDRDWKTNKTVLSGDIDNNDINSDGNFIAETTADIQGENANHIVTSSSDTWDAALDGFIITAASSGGMYNDQGSPTLMNITFSANLGGGMVNIEGNPTVLTNVTFIANSATYGGGVANYASNPILTNVVFLNNSATYGGGLYNLRENPSLVNVTFSGNSATYGGAIYNDGTAATSLKNSILWGDTATYGSEIFNKEGDSYITYSDVQGGWPGTGNIDADPMFAEPSGNLHLRSGSPAIDSGTNEGCPSTDLDGVIRPQDGNHDGISTCDMGAFEFSGIVATVDITPNNLNLKSKSKWVTAYIEFPNGFDIAAIDVNTLMLERTIPVATRLIATDDYDNDGIPDLMVKFSQPALIKYLNGMTGEVTLLVTGTLSDGTNFEGRDTVNVIHPGKK